jgi:hypothetical protein
MPFSVQPYTKDKKIILEKITKTKHMAIMKLLKVDA